jgi:hypothetical protein
MEEHKVRGVDLRLGVPGAPRLSYLLNDLSSTVKHSARGHALGVDSANASHELDRRFSCSFLGPFPRTDHFAQALGGVRRRWCHCRRCCFRHCTLFVRGATLFLLGALAIGRHAGRQDRAGSGRGGGRKVNALGVVHGDRRIDTIGIHSLGFQEPSCSPVRSILD